MVITFVKFIIKIKINLIYLFFSYSYYLSIFKIIYVNIYLLANGPDFN